METNKLIAGIVAAAIAVIVLAGVLMPALSDAVKTEDKYVNEGYYNLINIDNSTELTMTWDTQKPTVVTIDNVEISLTPTTGRYTLLGSDTFCIRYTAQNQIQAFGINVNDNYIYKSLLVSQGGVFTATVSQGEVVVEINGGSTVTYPLGDNAYCITSDSGDLVAVMKDKLKSAYVKGDSEIRLIGMSLGNNQSSALGISGIGTIDDGMTLSTLYIGTNYSEYPVTFSDITATYTKLTDHISLYSLEKYTFNVNYNNTETAPVTFDYFIVPAEVTAERSVHLSDAMNVILNVIPLLIIVAVLLGVVVVFILRRE